MSKIIEEVEGLYKIITLDAFRNTPGVTFDLIPLEMIPTISSLDRVLHQKSAISPGPVGEVKRPWYLHHFQDDNLVVLYGRREVDIYSVAHERVEHFTVLPNQIYKNGTLIYEGGAMLVWPRGVFHRIQSGDRVTGRQGSTRRESSSLSCNLLRLGLIGSDIIKKEKWPCAATF